jgi:oxygen-dependent protoporphyrinogen oxidase
VGYAQKAVVIGAGISGLACAFRLKQLGIQCLVLEAQDRAGGVIATIRRNGFLFETGPQCPRFPAPLWRLVQDLNLESEVVAGDKAAKRYIFRNGRMHSAPFSPGALLTTGLLGLSAKVRLLTEAFRSSHPPLQEESLADFVHRKFGTEVLDNLVDPVISTIFFGDPHRMGMESAFPALVQWERNQGSIVRGAIRASKIKREAAPRNAILATLTSNGKRGTWHVTKALPQLGSFRSGMGRLPERLAEVLGEQIRYGMGITLVAPRREGDDSGDKCWQIGLSNGDRILAEHVVLAVPAYAAAQLLASRAPQLASRLESIEYAPVCTVSSAYNRSQVANTLDGFGFMVPRREGLHTICTFWNSSLFPGRGPEGQVVMTSFAGPATPGEGQPETPEQCTRQVQEENARVLGITGEPVDRVFWKGQRALPQYNVGHARRIAEVCEMLPTLPNLYLAGNFLTGRSVGDCVETADRVAEALRSHVSV